MTAPDKIKAPFSRMEVWSLNAYQDSGLGHPYTCPNCGALLLATALGWICRDFAARRNHCLYTQNWAHTFTADWTWKGDFNQPPPPVPAGIDEWR